MGRFAEILGKLADRLLAVYADSAALRAVGPDLIPIAEQVPPISMRREVVEIHLLAKMVTVEVLFELENHGPDLEIDVGFPCFGAPGPFKARDAGLVDFKAVVDGEPVRDAERRLDNVAFPLWRVWRQRFQAGQTSHLAVRYWTPLESYAGVSRCPFVYVLRTGRFWQGRIGEASIQVHASGVPFRAIREVWPPPHEVDPVNRRISWRFVDLYPEQDIGLCVSPGMIIGDLLGLRVYDPIDIHEARPGKGTRVTLIGTLRGDDILPGERYWDSNIVIPDGIRAFDRSREAEAALTSIRMEGLASARKSVALTRYLGRWKPQLVKGCIDYRDGQAILVVDEEVDLRHSPDVHFRTHQRERFAAWIRGPYPPWNERFDLMRTTNWIAEPSRYTDDHSGASTPGARARLLHADDGLA